MFYLCGRLQNARTMKSLLRRYTLPKFPDFGKVDYSDYQQLL